GQDAKGRAIGGAEKPIADVHARVWEQPSMMDGCVHTKQYRDFDGACGMKPAVRVATKARVRVRVVDGDRERARARGSLEGVEPGVQRIHRVLTEGSGRHERGIGVGGARRGGHVRPKTRASPMPVASQGVEPVSLAVYNALMAANGREIERKYLL